MSMDSIIDNTIKTFDNRGVQPGLMVFVVRPKCVAMDHQQDGLTTACRRVSWAQAARSGRVVGVHNHRQQSVL